MAKGWVKLHRCLLDKPIWNRSTHEQRLILITILLLANHKEEEWEWNGQKFKCHPGQFVTSLPSLASKADCSIQNIRTALKRFKKYEFLTDQPTPTGRLITVVNWDKYQAKDDDLTDLLTDSQQTLNRPLTPNKNDKNDKNDKNVLSLEIEKFRTRYTPEQLKIINHYFEILRTTRRSGTISESVICGIYENMDKYDPLIVQYACTTVVNKPELHDKKENYFVGILRNTTIGEAVKTLQGGYRDSFKPFIKDKTALIDSIFDDMEANENG